MTTSRETLPRCYTPQAADARRGEGGKLKAEPVVQQSVGVQGSHTSKTSQAKAAASKTNPGAVARGDRLAKQREVPAK